MLRVSHAQETILRRRRQQHQDATNDFFSQPTGTARGIQAIDIKFANDCLKSINARQRFRLRQIAVQELGPIALGRKDVARWVSLTELQRRKFSALQDTFRDQGMLSSTELAQALNSVPPSTTIAGQEEVRHKRTMLTERFEIGRIRRQHNLESELIRLAQTLTKRQQKRWRLLKGRVFTRKSGG